MNWEHMKKNVGCRVQLVPTACRLDDYGRKLPNVDDEWIIQEVGADGVRISNSRTGHSTILGKDHIHHFTSNPAEASVGLKRGFLTLHVQIFLQGREARLLPNARPGDRVDPEPVQILDTVVDFRFPSDSQLQLNLEAKGYAVVWALEQKLPLLLRQGWEIVVAAGADGVLRTFRLRDRPFDQILLKRRRPSTSKA